MSSFPRVLLLRFPLTEFSIISVCIILAILLICYHSSFSSVHTYILHWKEENTVFSSSSSLRISPLPGRHYVITVAIPGTIYSPLSCAYGLLGI